MLLYHFPLTSSSSTPNFENRGINDDYTLESGWTFEKEGKLSSYCARTNKKGLTIPFGGDFTLCFRVKSKIAQTHFANLLSTGIINIFYHAEDSNYNVYAYMVGDVYARKLFTVDDNLFHDIVITRESDVVSMFVDKEKRGTCNNDASGEIKICYNPNYTHWDCYLQDIRVYDYALSQQEIKDYSKALALHYPLNKVGGVSGNANLLNGDINSASRWTADGLSRESYDDPQIGRCIKITNSTANTRVYNSVSNVWKASTTYTVSFYAKSSVNGVTCDMSRSIANFSQKFTLSTSWKKYVGQITSTETVTGGTLSFRINTASSVVYLANVKLELGSVATDWCPSSSDPTYTALGYNDTTVYDCSGFGNDGTAVNISSIDTSSPRYNCSTKFNGTNSYIYKIPDVLHSSIDEFTVSFWINSSNISSTQCIWTGRTTVDYSFAIHTIYSTVRFDTGTSSTYHLSTADTLSSNTWYHVCCVWKRNTKKEIYLNGGLNASTTSYGTPTKTNQFASIGMSSNNDSTPSSNPMSGSISDFRIYATALSADDIKLLYSRGASIDNTGKLHCGEITEGKSKIQVEKSTEVNCSSISEVYTKYDNTLYTEPDGSKWLRISHHNNPTAAKFASTDSFTTNVYRSTDIWFNVSICNYLDKWEMMVKQKKTSTADEQKYRWVQQTNPMGGTYEDVSPSSSKITKNTSGYTAGSGGGIYKLNSNSYLVIANGTKGNWYGAFGAWGTHNNGIPGYPNTIITTGYLDLYVRVDNVTFTQGNTKTQFLKEDNSINTAMLIEL